MTELFILGLLQQQPLSGYDIQQALTNSNVELWGGILVGSIYHALHKLEKNNYIKVIEIKTVGKRKTKIYKSTKTGDQYLQQIIKKQLATAENIFPSNTFAAITFSHLLTNDEVVTALKSQLPLLQQKVTDTTNGEREKEKIYINQLAKETFRYMQESSKLQIAYINNIIKIIESEKNNDN